MVISGFASLQNRGPPTDTIFTGSLDEVRKQMPPNILDKYAGRLRIATAHIKNEDILITDILPELLVLLDSTCCTGIDLVRLSINEEDFKEDSAVIYAILYKDTNDYQFYCGHSSTLYCERTDENGFFIGYTDCKFYYSDIQTTGWGKWSWTLLSAESWNDLQW